MHLLKGPYDILPNIAVLVVTVMFCDVLGVYSRGLLTIPIMYMPSPSVVYVVAGIVGILYIDFSKAFLGALLVGVIGAGLPIYMAAMSDNASVSSDSAIGLSILAITYIIPSVSYAALSNLCLRVTLNKSARNSGFRLCDQGKVMPKVPQQAQNYTLRPHIIFFVVFAIAHLLLSRYNIIFRSGVSYDHFLKPQAPVVIIFISGLIGVSFVSFFRAVSYSFAIVSALIFINSYGLSVAHLLIGDEQAKVVGSFIPGEFYYHVGMGMAYCIYAVVAAAIMNVALRLALKQASSNKEVLSGILRQGSVSVAYPKVTRLWGKFVRGFCGSAQARLSYVLKWQSIATLTSVTTLILWHLLALAVVVFLDVSFLSHPRYERHEIFSQIGPVNQSLLYLVIVAGAFIGGRVLFLGSALGRSLVLLSIIFIYEILLGRLFALTAHYQSDFSTQFHYILKAVSVYVPNVLIATILTNLGTRISLHRLNSTFDVVDTGTLGEKNG